MKILGIDLGSRAVKIAVFENNKFSFFNRIDTHIFYKSYCTNENGKIKLGLESLNIAGVDRIVGTGYGRNNLNVGNAEIITELKAHTYGSVWQTKLDTFTLLDIGGQDSKVISVKNGKMADMVLNDKCAASCGRYLENMANILGMDINEVESHFEDPVELSSTCAVFGESELIGRISEGYSPYKLAAGINYSLFRRIKPLIERFPGDTLVVSGGVAYNKALIYYIKKELNYRNVIIPENPQMNGAIGCCIFAVERKIS